MSKQPQGPFHEKVVVEPSDPAVRREDGQILEGDRTVYYALKGEEWRIPTSKLLWATVRKSDRNDGLERAEGPPFGYKEW
jgi:hypothetical protein